MGTGTYDGTDFALHSAVLSGYHRPPVDPPVDQIINEIQKALGPLGKPGNTPEHWVPMHGDLTPWNLREDERGLSLIDWESVGWGPPAADEVLFTATSPDLGLHAPGGPLDVEAAAFWSDRFSAADNPPDARPERRLLALLENTDA